MYTIYLGIFVNLELNLLQPIKTINKKIIELVLKDYHQISLWYFVFFLFGCLFSLSKCHWTSSCIIPILINIFVIILIINSKCNIQKYLFYLIFFFTLGVLASEFKKFNARSNKLEDNVVDYFQGTIGQITKLSKSTRIVLKNPQYLNNSISRDINSKGDIRLTIQDKYLQHIEIGDQILIRAKLTQASQETTPGGYNFHLHAKLNNIQATGFCLSSPIIIKKNSDIWSNLRKTIYTRITGYLKQDPANFILALIIGDYQGMQAQTIRNIRISGISHLLCISGLHLTLVTLICFRFFRFILNVSNYLAHNHNIKLIAGILSIIFSYFYLELSGTKVSATRAFIMSSCANVAIMLHRDYNPMRAVSIASFLILAISPQYTINPSFHLSFIAVLALIWQYNQHLSISTSAKHGIFIKSIKIIWSNLYSSAFVGIVTGPIVAYHFNMFSNYSPITNLIAVPITTFILMPCVFIFLISMPFNAEQYPLKFMSYFVEIIINIANKIANLPYSSIYTGHIDDYHLIIYIFGFLWLVIWKSQIRLLGIAIIAISIILMNTIQRPCFVLDIPLNTIALRTKDEKIELYSETKPSNFIQNNWANWFGQESIDKLHMIERSNRQYLTKHNILIEVIFNNLDCNSKADLILNYSEDSCMSKKFINLNDSSERFIGVYGNKTKDNLPKIKWL